MTSIVIFASGTGTGFEAIADAVSDGRLQAKILGLVCDQPNAAVLEKARSRGIRSILVPRAVGESRERHDERILSEILPLSPRFLVMAGYMRILTPRLLEAFRSERGYARVVNIHPSLLPAFPGVGAYAQAFRHGVQVTGATVHLVELEVDSGPICAQIAFSIEGLTSEKQVEERGKAIERELYPRVLQWVLPEKFEVTARDQSSRRLCVRPN